MGTLALCDGVSGLLTFFEAPKLIRLTFTIWELFQYFFYLFFF
jgi:hypothetical protein